MSDTATAGDTFTCERCRGTFEKEWTDEEAEAEALGMFGNLEDMAMVCDDCWLNLGFGQVPMKGEA